MANRYIVPKIISLADLNKEMVELLEQGAEYAAKADLGNSSAGVNYRKILKMVQKKAVEARYAVQDRKFPNRAGQSYGRFKKDPSKP